MKGAIEMEDNIYYKKTIEYIDIQYFKGKMNEAWKEEIEKWFKKYGFDELTMIELFNYCYSRQDITRSYIKTVVEAIIICYGFNLLVGLIPVLATLRKTPAAILARTDLD